MDRAEFLAGAVALPFLAAAAAPSAANVEGNWIGTLRYGGDSETFALAFKKGKGGKLVAYMWNPAVGVYGLPASHVDVRNAAVTLIEAKLPLRYDGMSLTGTLSPIGDRIVLTRATAPLPAAPPAPPGVSWPIPRRRWQRTVGPVWAAPAVRGSFVYAGDARGVLHALDANSGTVAWTYDAKSAIFGTAAVDGNALLLLDARDVLHRIDATTGKALWTRVLGKGRVHDLPSPASRQFEYRSATPAVLDGAAYVGTGDGAFCALDASTGDLKWSRRVATSICSTAALTGGRAIFGTWDGDVVALDLAGGNGAWKLATGKPVTMPVVVYRDVAIAGSRNALLYGIDVRNGKPVWKRYYFTSWVESAPAIVDGVAYAGSSDLHGLRAFDPSTGKTRWNATVFGWSWGTPLVVDGIVYAGTSAMAPYLPGMLAGRTALRAADGSLLWRDAKPPQTGIVTGYGCGPVRCGDAVVYASVLGDVSAFSL